MIITKKNDIFVQGINGTTNYAEKLYKINFAEKNKKFCLSLHYNGENSYLFVNGIEIQKSINLKQKTLNL